MTSARSARSRGSGPGEDRPLIGRSGSVRIIARLKLRPSADFCLKKDVSPCALPLPPPLRPCAFASPASAQPSGPRPPTISVIGTGEVELKPDFARILVTVATQADTVAQATGANSTATERVLARIQGLGIKREDIRTANFQVFQTPQQVGPDGKGGEGAEILRQSPAAHHHPRSRRRRASRRRDPGERRHDLPVGRLRPRPAGGGRRQGPRGGRARCPPPGGGLCQRPRASQLGRLIEIRDGSAQPFEPQPDMRMSMAMAKGAESVPIVPPATIRYTATVQMVWEMAPKP